MPSPDNVFFGQSERTFVFIDGPNNHGAAKALGIDIDYKKLLTGLRAVTRVMRVYYYTPVIGGEDYSSIRPLLDWLDYNGYEVITKPIKEYTLEDGSRRVKANMDVELTVDAIRHAICRHMDHMILFSGNGDLRALVAAVKNAGVRVSVVSTLKTQPVYIADELRRAADQFLELKDMNINRAK